MIAAYIDDSGSHEGAPVSVAAGYFGAPAPWQRFGKDWTACLGRHGLKLDGFHAKDFLKNRRRREVVLDLSRLIAKYAHKIHPVCCATIVPEFHSLSVVQRKFITGGTIDDKGYFRSSGKPKAAFFLPFINCIRRMVQYVPIGEKMNCYVGLGSPLAEYADALWDQLKSLPNADARFGKIQFPPHAETPCLQAADLFAHHQYLRTPKRIQTGRTLALESEVEGNLISGAKNSDKDITFQDGNDILETLKRAPQPYRDFLIHRLEKP